MQLFAVYKAGKLRNGDQRGHGSVIHYTDGDPHYGPEKAALCGAVPAIEWSKARDAEATCPKCKKIAAANAPAQHDWQKSTLGHGETMCKRCFITNREAAVLGLLNRCEA